jgi:dTDP-4-dehydrorhamnose 3,5-epimerase
MEIVAARIPAVRILTPRLHRDERGAFAETYREDKAAAAGLELRWVQENHSMSLRRGTLRGLHFQKPPHAQDKLVRVLRGAIQDVAVDIRAGSPTYGEHVSVVLSAENQRQIYVPKGFLHGFVTLEDNVEVVYKVSDYYSPETDAGVVWNDADIGVAWDLAGAPILSDKDARLPRLSELPPLFDWVAAA